MLAKRSLKFLKSGLERRLFSGAAYALVSKKLSGGVGTLGRLAFDDECDRVNRNTLFDLASLTKPFATSMATLQLVARGDLHLEDSAGELLGTRNHLNEISVFHLLTHTSGLPAVPDGEAGTTSPLDAALQSAPRSAPGKQYVYSDTGYILLGEIIRRRADGPLDGWYNERIMPELHLADGGFSPDRSVPIVATSNDESLDGLPHDPRARAMGNVAGHAGLFGSINDIAAYARALLGSGRALLPAPLFERLFTNELSGDVGFQSLAFFRNGNPLMPDIAGFSRASIGHAGFTGCFVLIDRENEAAACLLTNRVLAGDDATAFLALRKSWLTGAAEDLGLC